MTIITRYRPALIVFLILLSLLLPLWNIPDTIALRYFSAFLLLVIVIISKPDWGLFFKSHITLALLFIYLIVQLVFFSTDYAVSFHNFKSEWLKFILFAFLGVGCGFILASIKFERLNLFLGFLFAIPLLIHLTLCLIKGVGLHQIPFGYWGINKTHGDLAYTSIHATTFVGVFLIFQAKSLLDKRLSLFLLAVCLLSPLIASSRGGTLFVFISLGVVFFLGVMTRHRAHFSLKNLLLYLFAMVILMLSAYQFAMYFQPERWGGTLSRIEMGFEGDALNINCEGAEALEKTLQQDGVEITPQIKAFLESVKDGDAARVMAARSAIQLIPQHWMGIDQARRAYVKALEQACGHPAKIQLTSAHNGWLDTSLAIGVIGATLYFLVLCQFIKQGLGASFQKSTDINPYGVALCSLSLIWIVRSLFDSAQQDQVLEMQIFTMCLLSALIVFQSNNKLIPQS